MYMQLMTGNMTINKQHVAAPPQSAYLSLSHTHTHTKNTTQVVDSLMGSIIISPLSIIIIQIHITIQT